VLNTGEDMNILKSLLLLSLISCGAVDNVFNDGKKNSSVIGQILPSQVAPEIVIDSPIALDQVGKIITLSGRCSETKSIEVSSSDITPSSVTTNCVNEKFEVVVNSNVSSDQQIELTTTAINGSKSDSKKVIVEVVTEIPVSPTHIDINQTKQTSISLNWNQSSSTTLPLKGYILEYKESADTTWIQHPSNPINASSMNVEGLIDSTQYDFRVKAFNGNDSDYSQVSGKTKPLNDFFDDKIRVFNIAGATQSSLVAIEDGDFYLNENLLVSLNAGEVHTFTSTQFDKISSDKAFYVAGVRKNNSNSASRSANMVWTTQDWASTNFTFAASRSATHILSIVAYEDANIVVKSGAATISTQTILKDQGITVDLTQNANYQIESTGLISAFVYSATGSKQELRDPRPILPASTDILGFPSREAFISASEVNATLDITHSNDHKQSHTFANLNSLFIVKPQGAADRYKSEAVRIKSTSQIEGVSVADFDGYCAAPFIPRAKMKNTFAVNVLSEWVAFTSVDPGTITVKDPSGSTQSVQLTRSGSDADAPYKARLTNIPAGTIFSATVKMGAWYEPKTNSFGANDDETLLFGYNL
jgi:hypothetical protein